MLFIIIHGSFASPESNWFTDLKEKLEALNQEVLCPAFPTESYDAMTARGEGTTSEVQTLAHWLKTFELLLPRIRSADKVCVIGISLLSGPRLTDEP